VEKDSIEKKIVAMKRSGMDQEEEDEERNTMHRGQEILNPIITQKTRERDDQLDANGGE